MRGKALDNWKPPKNASIFKLQIQKPDSFGNVCYTETSPRKQFGFESDFGCLPKILTIFCGTLTEWTPNTQQMEVNVKIATNKLTRHLYTFEVKYYFFGSLTECFCIQNVFSVSTFHQTTYYNINTKEQWNVSCYQSAGIQMRTFRTGRWE